MELIFVYMIVLALCVVVMVVMTCRRRRLNGRVLQHAPKLCICIGHFLRNVFFFIFFLLVAMIMNHGARRRRGSVRLQGLKRSSVNK